MFFCVDMMFNLFIFIDVIGVVRVMLIILDIK